MRSTRIKRMTIHRGAGSQRAARDLYPAGGAGALAPLHSRSQLAGGCTKIRQGMNSGVVGIKRHLVVLTECPSDGGKCGIYLAERRLRHALVKDHRSRKRK